MARVNCWFIYNNTALKGWHIPAMGVDHRIYNDGLAAIAGICRPFRARTLAAKKYSKNYLFDIKNYSLTYETVPDLDIFQKKPQKMDKTLKNLIQNVLSKTYKR